jgi:hypothetical protein
MTKELAIVCIFGIAAFFAWQAILLHMNPPSNDGDDDDQPTHQGGRG